MGEHQRRYYLPDGHFAVTDPEGRETYWWVEGGRLRDYAPGRRWRLLPPPRPADVPPEDRHQWREQWYEDVYWVFKAEITSAISADPLAAAHRFRDRFAAQIPEPRRRVRRREPMIRQDGYVYDHQLSPADLAEAARQLRALIEALPPTTPRDRATARRIEGAAVALEALATHARAAVAGQDVLDRPDPG